MMIKIVVPDYQHYTEPVSRTKLCNTSILILPKKLANQLNSEYASVWSAARRIRNLSSIILSPFVVVTLLSSLNYYMPHAMLFYIRTNSKLFEFVHLILAKWQMCLLNRIRQINRGQLIVRQFNCFLPKKTKRRKKSLHWFGFADRDLTINLCANVCYSLAKRSRTESRVSSPIIGRLIVITISWLWKWS